MIQHIATTKRRHAADSGAGPGGQQAGPTQNDIAQGQCFADIAGGVAQSVTDNFAGLAGAAVASIAGSSIGAMVGAGTAGLINATEAGINAFNDSEACQQLDNSALANELGLGGVVAP